MAIKDVISKMTGTYRPPEVHERSASFVEQMRARDLAPEQLAEKYPIHEEYWSVVERAFHETLGSAAKIKVDLLKSHTNQSFPALTQRLWIIRKKANWASFIYAQPLKINRSRRVIR